VSKGLRTKNGGISAILSSLLSPLVNLLFMSAAPVEGVAAAYMRPSQVMFPLNYEFRVAVCATTHPENLF